MGFIGDEGDAAIATPKTAEIGTHPGFCPLIFDRLRREGAQDQARDSAIALEFAQTQQALSQQLRTPVPTFKIQHVSVSEQTPLRIEGLSAYRIQGQYDAEVKFPGKRYQQAQNIFDVYLQQQPPSQQSTKTDVIRWRLAIPQIGEPDAAAGSQRWKTFPLYDEQKPDEQRFVPTTNIP
ncbi:MAG: hypothetical protein HC857_13190 [Synechococcales cyanobacterium RU_4_20]|nr:hypothetical protein [Synechococcales cyanobacterium RU_4_20]